MSLDRIKYRCALQPSCTQSIFIFSQIYFFLLLRLKCKCSSALARNIWRTFSRAYLFGKPRRWEEKNSAGHSLSTYISRLSHRKKFLFDNLFGGKLFYGAVYCRRILRGGGPILEDESVRVCVLGQECFIGLQTFQFVPIQKLRRLGQQRIFFPLTICLEKNSLPFFFSTCIGQYFFQYDT